MVRSTCADCGSKKCSFKKMQAQDGEGLFDLAKTAYKNRKGISQGINLIHDLTSSYKN